jgi:hypothetical protein
LSQSRQKRPLLAALLQFLCLTGGLGYLYLGQWKRGLKLLVLLLALQAAVAGGSTAGAYWVGMVLGPVIFTLQALSAYDAWRIAKRLDPVPALRWF